MLLPDCKYHAASAAVPSLSATVRANPFIRTFYAFFCRAGGVLFSTVSRRSEPVGHRTVRKGAATEKLQRPLLVHWTCLPECRRVRCGASVRRYFPGYLVSGLPFVQQIQERCPARPFTVSCCGRRRFSARYFPTGALRSRLASEGILPAAKVFCTRSCGGRNPASSW